MNKTGTKWLSLDFDIGRIPAISWRAIIGNCSETAMKYSIHVVMTPADGISLMGPVHYILAASNIHREITFLVRLKQKGSSSRLMLLQLFSGDMLIATVKIKF